MATVTLCVHNREFSVSQFSGHFFNSAVKFGGRLLIANSTGVNASTKEGTVDSYVVFPSTDMDYQGQKGLRSLLLTGRFTGKMQAEVFYDNGTSQLFESVNMLLETGCKIALRTLPRSRVFKIKISNVEGLDFSLTSAKVIFIASPERRM